MGWETTPGSWSVWVTEPTKHLPVKQNPGEKDVDMKDVDLDLYIQSCNNDNNNNNNNNHVDDSWQKVKISYIP